MLAYEIIVDHGETPNKCTILPLAYRSDFTILRGRVSEALRADVLLHPEGAPLDSLRFPPGAVKRLAAIDCIWRRLEPILEGIDQPHPLRARIPDGFLTAYPRTSRKDFDPDGGLATIEAIFIAAAFLGSWDQSLLREYFFAEQFLEMNRKTFEGYGLGFEFQSPVFQPLHPKNSRTRRIGRGRVPL